MAEWSIAAVLKTAEGHTSGGSNPSLSAHSEWNQLKISWFHFYFTRCSPRLLPRLLSYNFFVCTFVLVL